MTTMEVAADFVARGYAPIPIPRGEKRPLLEGWQNLRITDDATLARYFAHDCNVGVLLGEASGGLVDVDLDHPDAVRLADEMLPKTAAIFGRASKRGSHRLYRVTGGGGLVGTKRWATPQRACICEVRGFGGQTVFPGSIHPSGEAIEWETDGEPAEVEWDTLREACDRIYERVTGLQPTSTVALQSTHRSGQPDDSPHIVKRAEKYLEGIPGAIAGQNGHGQTFAAATCLVHGFGLSADTSLNMLLALYNPRCDPPWTERELVHKINQASSTGHSRPYGWLRDAQAPMAKGYEYVGGDPYSTGDIQAAKENPPATGQIAGGEQTSEAKTGEPKSTPKKVWVPFPIGKLIEENPTLAEPLIDGVLRLGETANFIGAPKTGKSILALTTALSIAAGRPWFGRPVRKSRVLIIDNELHKATAAHRAARAAQALGIHPDEFHNEVFFEALRGKLESITDLRRIFDCIEVGQFGLVIIDALYRALPVGVEENDNAGMAGVYNTIDRYADRTGAAFLLIHHTSKGNQSEKAVTDAGSGAGAQSRAVDAHMVLRPHEEEGAVVLDGAVRSWAPIKPEVFWFKFPVFEKDHSGLDPADLRSSKPRKKEKPDDGWSEQAPQWTPERIAREVLSHPMSEAMIQEALLALPSGPKDAKSVRWVGRQLTLAMEKGLIVSEGRGKMLRYRRP